MDGGRHDSARLRRDRDLRAASHARVRAAGAEEARLGAIAASGCDRLDQALRRTRADPRAHDRAGDRRRLDGVQSTPLHLRPGASGPSVASRARVPRLLYGRVPILRHAAGRSGNCRSATISGRARGLLHCAPHLGRAWSHSLRDGGSDGTDTGTRRSGRRGPSAGHLQAANACSRSVRATGRSARGWSRTGVRSTGRPATLRRTSARGRHTRIRNHSSGGDYRSFARGARAASRISSGVCAACAATTCRLWPGPGPTGGAG